MSRLAVLGVILAGAVLSAQQPPPTTPPPAQPPQPPPAQPQQPPIFRTTLELVRVDATVIDSSGKPVTTLTADDFALQEDGVPQKIQQFKLLDLDGHPEPGDDVSLAVTSRAHAATEVAREDVRVFLVFWDDYHIPQLAANLLRDALTRFLWEGLGPTDMVAVMTQFTPTSDIRFRRDHRDMVFDLERLEGRKGIYMPRNVAEENHLRRLRGIEWVRSEVSATALRSAIAHLGAIREGRKTLLYLSQEYGFGRSTPTETMSLIQAANDANVAVYSVNPDGLRVGRGGRFGLLSDLAHNTGGESLLSNSLDLILKRAVAQSSATYLLGYAPSPMRHDGKFHKISVRVKPRGLQVRARNGYWAPHPGQVRRAMEAAAAAPPASSPVVKAFGELSRLATPALDDEPRLVRTILSPEGGSSALAMAEPRVWVVRRPAELRDVLGDAPPPPIDRREFARTDRLIVRVNLAGSLAGEAQVTARLLGKGGARLTDLPLTRVEHIDPAWRVDLPLSSIARGDYVIALEAAAGVLRAAAYLPIRVLGR
jgi:VWFA-related protein